MILIDHAHCEKKAASTALSFISRYPGRTALVEKMSALAIEEMEHFCRVHELLLTRGIRLTFDRADEYVNELFSHTRKQEPMKLLDSLLVAALIEARSCERFTLLAQELHDAEIRDLYKDLISSEAGHYMLFLSLAKEYFTEEEVRNRFDELRIFESQCVNLCTPTARMHG